MTAPLLDLPMHARGSMRGCPVVHGRCPACGVAALGLGAGGHVTCANLSCPQPDAAADLLAPPCPRCGDTQEVPERGHEGADHTNPAFETRPCPECG